MESDRINREIRRAHARNGRHRYAVGDEAERLYEATKSNDPLPQIAPALLNSADIAQYVKNTGMIDPFHAEDLKPASYEIQIRGDWLFWDADGTPREGTLSSTEDELCVPRNSIAFVILEPMLRIPDYIALRFNLKIRHVYKGLLLGTGPLVDPGFVGRLSLPLHNLTTNDYVFRGGDGLIWMEFTKVSPNRRWSPAAPQQFWRGFSYVPFDPEKTRLQAIRGYLDKAVGSRPVRSSIPDETRKAQAVAKQAQRWAGVGFAAIAAFLLGLTTLAYSAWGAYQTSVDVTGREAQRAVDVMERALERQEERMEVLEERLRDVETRPTQRP